MPDAPEALMPYREAVGPLAMKAGAEPLVSGGSDPTVHELEGKWPYDEGPVVVIKFPSMEALKTFWNSSEYQAVKHLRTDVMKSNFVVAVEGD